MIPFILLIVVPLLVTVTSFVLAGMAFLGFDIIVSTVYQKATEQQQAQLNKAPFLQQASIVFLAIGLVSLCSSLLSLLEMWLFSVLAVVLFCGVIVYYILSERKLKQLLPSETEDTAQNQEAE